LSEVGRFISGGYFHGGDISYVQRNARFAGD
jgi:hypothetical protein